MAGSMNRSRVIFHIDMNCFYASVEVAANPKLKGKPLAIAGNPQERKGIIVTSSYEARAKGVKTTMPLWEAKRLCPNLIVLRPDFTKYRAASEKLFRMLAEITPIVQPVSIDEGYMDLSEIALKQHPVELAYKLQNNILQELHLPASIGIAPNKFLAKMASDMKKPLGITILRKRDIPQKLWPLAIGEMYGVGSKTAEKFERIGVHTIGDLAHADLYQLKRLLGINGERLQNRANGIDSNPVDPDAVHEFKSIGSSQTLPEDTVDLNEIQKLISKLAENVEKRLQRKQAVGKTVQLMIRYHDRKTITRSKKLPNFIDSKEDIVQIAGELLQKHWNQDPVRLIGVTVLDAEDKTAAAKQLNLFTYEQEENKAKLESVIGEMTKKYGENIIRRMQTDHKEDNQVRTSFQKDFLDDFRKKK
ncbi:DNA polymerase IV [Virgibacillus halophilus]|uniref:DNA polymerase IV n=1 Tax=Tigheibacillus halophilus TaxID=361280 RepID=UPI0036260E7D